MVQKSSFFSDLNKEQQLTKLLDSYYINQLKHYSFERVSNKKEQHQGVDVRFVHKKTGDAYLIDEKAQLDYINEDLPTFAFEILYYKDGTRKPGWLFDNSKTTQFYTLATGIYAGESEEFLFCKVTFVNRQKLIAFLEKKNITKKILLNHFDGINANHGKMVLDQLNVKNEGYLFYSKANKAERPLNLILRLDWLIEQRIAKRLI